MMLAQTMAMFGSEELKKLGYQSGAYHHMIAEALRAAVADRMRYLGDPAFESVSMQRLMAPKRLAERRRSMALDRTHALPRFGLEGHGTHHLTTLDRQGNMVALTTTVNRLFGAKFTGSESGVVLNDELDDFTERSAVTPFGMTESPNRARPGARPISSMTPTIVVRNNQAVLGLGGSGGTTIPTNVTQLTLAHLVFGRTPQQAVSDRRFYIPTKNAYILLEKAAPPALRQDLKWRGEIVGEMPFDGTAVQMVAVQNGQVLAAADPRKHGLALTY
jgi:gamma-glutamyltranspeptidase/glutathione hydrolase